MHDDRAVDPRVLLLHPCHHFGPIADRIDGATMAELRGVASGMAEPAFNASDPDLASSHK